MPSGYIADTGLDYGSRANGLNYGWNQDNTAAARDRDAANSPDELHDGLIHMQKPSSPNAGQCVAGETSGGSATAGAEGHTPTSANSSKIAAAQSQKPTRLR